MLEDFLRERFGGGNSGESEEDSSPAYFEEDEE